MRYLPDVTVAATSPVLIEKVRSAITDGNGQYRIEDLRPGIYSVSFGRAGLARETQEGIELTGSLTITVNAELRIGSLSESVTVTGANSVVDVYSSHREMNLSGEVVRSVPTARTYNALLVLVPGVVTSSNDTVTSPATIAFPMHGGRSTEGRLWLDGLNIGSPPNGNSATSYGIDIGNAAEVTFTTAGARGEMETSGLVMNVIPKSGGNATHGSFFASGTGAIPAIRQFDGCVEGAGRDRGDAADEGLRFLRDGGGADPEGPGVVLRQCTLGRQHQREPNVYYNQNAADPSKWLYQPDFNRRSTPTERSRTRADGSHGRRHRATRSARSGTCKASAGSAPARRPGTPSRRAPHPRRWASWDGAWTSRS